MVLDLRCSNIWHNFMTVDLWSQNSLIFAYCKTGTTCSSKATTIRLAAPTISDLLNPASSSGEEQEITFILDDPYGANQMVDKDDGDNHDGDNPGHMLHVTLGMDLVLLGIEEYMDLSKTKLRAWFDESVTQPASTPSNFVTALSTPATIVEATFTTAAWASGFAW
jgi:hypothetical protein